MGSDGLAGPEAAYDHMTTPFAPTAAMVDSDALVFCYALSPQQTAIAISTADACRQHHPAAYSGFTVPPADQHVVQECRE
mmetsp:Transcript_28126/g.70219  ORF Transcript_28126/g.70219 Transcript_28126/m.70219 type:complete len:80 (-) Transcript_28126:21-260(-)